MSIDKNKVEEILKKLWKEDDGFVSIERISYNKALQDIQYEIDKLEIKENSVSTNSKSNQPSKKMPTWKHWENGIAGNEEGKPIYLTKVGNTYSLTSCLGLECDYIELSELDKLLSEKQDEQNHNGKKWIYEDVYLKEIEQLYQDGINEVLENPQKYGLEKITNNPNKVGPKFKVGDWVTTKDAVSTLIIKNVNVGRHQYEMSFTRYGGKKFHYIDYIDSNCHLWSTKDARDGDVLASDNSVFIFKEKYIAEKPTAYCGIMNGQFIQGQDGCWTNERYYPASEEDFALLMHKMNDEGYQFDFVNKELKPLSNQPIE